MFKRVPDENEIKNAEADPPPEELPGKQRSMIVASVSGGIEFQDPDIPGDVWIRGKDLLDLSVWR